jgi:HEAT repeat protein
MSDKIAELIQQLGSDDSAVCAQAMAALIAALKDKDEDVAVAACKALRSFPAEAAQAVPALIEALRGETRPPLVTEDRPPDANTPNRRYFSIRPKLEMEAAQVRHLPSLCDEAADVLCELGATAIPALINELNPKDYSIHYVLGRMAPEVSVAALIGALGHERAEVRGGAAQVLEDLRRLPKEAIPALRQAANDPDPLVREIAQEALEKYNEYFDN